MQCSGRRSSRGVGPDTCLVISHAHRIAVNEQEKATGAGRRNAGAGTKVAKGSFVHAIRRLRRPRPRREDHHEDHDHRDD